MERKQTITRVFIQFGQDVSKELYLRGEGIPDLSWEKGIKIKHISPHEWVFETNTIFSSGLFKVLINDEIYELGENHPIYPGASIRINPKFPKTH
ncbi:MAG: hypothetical protein R3E91_02235 [Chlamydiales bacterium]